MNNIDNVNNVNNMNGNVVGVEPEEVDPRAWVLSRQEQVDVCYRQKALQDMLEVVAIEEQLSNGQSTAVKVRKARLGKALKTLQQGASSRSQQKRMLRQIDHMLARMERQ